jgi:hypothetical protein
MKKISYLTSVIVLGASLAAPFLAGAAGLNTTYVKGYADSVTGIINNILVPVLIAIAFLVFLWGVYKYFIQGASNDAERATGRTFVLYGVIGFVIIFSIWGIVQIFIGTLGFGTTTNSPNPPTIGGSAVGGSTTGGSYPVGECVNGSCSQYGTGYRCSNGYCIANN